MTKNSLLSLILLAGSVSAAHAAPVQKPVAPSVAVRDSKLKAVGRFAGRVAKGVGTFALEFLQAAGNSTSVNTGAGGWSVTSKRVGGVGWSSNGDTLINLGGGTSWDATSGKTTFSAGGHTF